MQMLLGKLVMEYSSSVSVIVEVMEGKEAKSKICFFEKHGAITVIQTG